MVVTVDMAPRSVLAVSSLGTSSVAVAVGALVVVIAIVLVFVMLLRGNGGSRKTASGIGYDAQHGPIGQPRPDANAGGNPWQQQAGAPQPGARQAQAAWPQQGPDTFGAGAQPSQGGRGNAANWGQMQDLGGDMGGGAPSQRQPEQNPWGSPAPQRAQNPWGEPTPAAGNASPWAPPASAPASEQWPPQTAAGWNAPQVPPNQPAQAQPGWDMPASPSQPTGGRSGWGPANGNQAPVPWDQPEASAPAWGASPAAPGWNAPAAPTAPQRDWNQGSAPQAPAAPPQGSFGAPDFGGEADKTRVVRPGAGAAGRTGMIVVRQGKEPGRIFEVRKDRLTIGRSRESDIFLEDLAVSRLHTTVARDDSGRYILRDENSANGTYVNSQKVGEHVLEEGDEIQVGQTVLAFVRR